MTNPIPDRIQKTVLPNGLRVLTETIKTVRSLSVGIWVKTGSRHETEEQAGITHFLEHMLFKGTEQRSAYDIARSMEAVGGYLNAFTSPELTCYYARCLDSELDTALDVLTDMVLHSSFPEEEIEKEKKVVLEEMKMYRDNPEDFVFEEFHKQLFMPHPLGRPIIGYESTVNAFDRKNLFEYIEQQYHPSNVIIAVTGNAGHEEVLALVEKYFQPVDRPYQINGDVPVTEYNPTKVVLKKPIEQTHFILGNRCLSAMDPNRFKLLLANTVLGSGMSSRLHQNIREKYGYCYHIQSFMEAFRDSGIFGIYAGTDRQYVDHMRELILAELTRLKEELIPQNELDEAKSQLKGKLLLAQESMSNRMTRLAKSEVFYDRYITLDELVAEIDGADAKQIRDLCNTCFIEEDLSETILMPEHLSE
ncbi:pitrilysin family protein [Balneolaceae bacterium ANBcel3]|nr:pitrilysin family protein [Balneolaceae bacterium ANBcel3]